tara:strand:- start:92 stop:220 length:129 start_codon:yes stop_codon:yes gene_type:complete
VAAKPLRLVQARRSAALQRKGARAQGRRAAGRRAAGPQGFMK